MATIIDLGMARRVGTSEVYSQTSRTNRYPWIAPELLRHTHPCCEASDVYGLAYLIEKKLDLEERDWCSPSVAALELWLREARDPDPSGRPGLTALVEVLDALHQEAINAIPLE